MKEASGEANLTVITIILIGVILTIATPIITNLISSIGEKTQCVNNGGTWVNGRCN